MFWLTLIYFYNTWQGSSEAERRTGVLQEQFPAPPAPNPAWAPTPKSLWAHKGPTSPASVRRSLLWPLGTRFSGRTAGLGDPFRPIFRDFQPQIPSGAGMCQPWIQSVVGHTWVPPGHLLLPPSSRVG